MEKIILEILNDSIKVKQNFIMENIALIEKGAIMMAKALKQGNKILLIGNGGSAADAQHIAAEFVNRFQMERKPLAAIALTTDTSIITSIGNDYSFDDIFLKQVQAIGKKQDIIICLSTSGNSLNIIKAALEAKSMKLKIIGMSGPTGKLKKISDIAFCIDSKITARIQETHITLAHILCDLTERILFDG